MIRTFKTRKILAAVLPIVVAGIALIYGTVDVATESIQFDLKKIGESIYGACQKRQVADANRRSRRDRIFEDAVSQGHPGERDVCRHLATGSRSEARCESKSDSCLRQRRPALSALEGMGLSRRFTDRKNRRRRKANVEVPLSHGRSTAACRQSEARS